MVQWQLLCFNFLEVVVVWHEFYVVDVDVGVDVGVDELNVVLVNRCGTGSCSSRCLGLSDGWRLCNDYLFLHYDCWSLCNDYWLYGHWARCRCDNAGPNRRDGHRTRGRSWTRSRARCCWTRDYGTRNRRTGRRRRCARALRRRRRWAPSRR